ncbi:MFS transporter [Halostella sp. JP-L12]|uniref:MFS transporter n=1 Tax=Halostella TaxID=1843185 RepID=UPI000EF7923E|nr:MULTISPECIES: MFS transporter [Halostella]NHN48112.1 MFS transporter [Halostella sp. JP-L12]
MAESRRLIWKYYAYRASSAAGFYLPVSVLYLKDQGYGLAFIGLAQAVFSFALLLSEIPSGYLGDRIGRRGSLALGNALRASAMVAYVFAGSAAGILAVKAVWAMGWAFRSGTQSAWLYELLSSRFDESEYARIDGRGSTVLLVTSGVGAVVGGGLYTVDTGLPFLVNAALASAGIAVLATFPCVECGDDADDAFTVREAVRVLRVQVRRPEVRWFVAYAALFAGLFGVTRTFEQPALDAAGVPVVGIGLLYAGFKAVSAAAASATGWLNDALGVRLTFALFVPAFAVAYAGIALSPLLLVPTLVLYRAAQTVIRPLRNQYLNDRLGDIGRATVLSGASMALSLASGAAKLAGGAAAGSLGAVGVLPWAGLTVAGIAGLLWIRTSPVRDQSTAPASAPAVAAESD